MRTLVVWCPDWPVTALGLGQTDRVAVLEAGRVLVASAAAREAGVRVGSRRREAESRCPGLVVRTRDLVQEARAFEPVVAALCALTPEVEVTRPGLVALDSRGPARYFGGEEALCRRVAATAGAALSGATGATVGHGSPSPVVGTTAGIAAAGSPVPPPADAATAAAGSPVPPPGATAAGATVLSTPPPAVSPAVLVGIADGRFAATLAARRGVVVAPGSNAGFLAPFPLSVLGRPELAGLLHRLGIRTLGDLAALPETAMVSRFGAEAGSLHALARGLDDQVLQLRAPDEELMAATELDPPADRAEVAAFVARSVVGELLAQLGQRGLVCTRVRIEAETEHGEVLVRRWRGSVLGAAGGSSALGADAMVERLRWQLDGWLSGSVAEPAPTAGITRLVLAADEVAPAGGRQLGLWGGASDADRRAVWGLDRLRGTLGPDAVGTAAVTGGRAPADRVAFIPWGEPRPSRPDAPWPGCHPEPAPAIVHGARVPAEVVGAGGAPVTVSARGRPSEAPARLSVDGGPWTPITGWAGPWTADERWWDPAAHRRLARFQVVTDTHQAHLCLVTDGHWWIEATYD